MIWWNLTRQMIKKEAYSKEERWIYEAAERGDSCRFRTALTQNAQAELQQTSHK